MAIPLTRGLNRNTLDDFVNNPALGIPILGHFLNAQALPAAYLTAQSPWNPADVNDIIDNEGLLQGWNQRTDIHPLTKMGAEVLTGGLIPGANLPFDVAGQLFSAGMKSLKASSIGKTLLAPSARAEGSFAREAVERIGHEFDKVSEGMTPDDFVDMYRDFDPATKTFNNTDYADILFKFDPAAQKTFTDMASAVPSKKVDKLLEEAQKLGLNKTGFDILSDEYGRTARNAAGGSRQKLIRRVLPDHIADKVETVNRNVDASLLSSGLYPLPNVFDDMLVKALANGISTKQLWEDFWHLKNTGRQTVPDLERFMGGDYLDPRVAESKFLNRDKPLWLEGGKLPLNQAVAKGAGIGAGLGAASAGVQMIQDGEWHPENVLAGAVGGALTPAGLRLGSKLSRLLETPTRGRFYYKRAEEFLNEPEQLAKIEDLLSVSNKRTREALRKQLFTPDGKFIPTDAATIAAIAAKNRGTANVINHLRVVNHLRQEFGALNDLAKDEGFRYVASQLGDYAHPNNITDAVGSFTPFPKWAMFNLGWYGDFLAKHPDIARSLATYAKVAQDDNGAPALPPKFENRVPVANLPGGEFFANPLSPFSITSQITPPDLERSTGLDRVMALLGMVGLGLRPTLQYPLQALGLINKGSDFASINPWMRLAQSEAQSVLGGDKADPEAALKFPFESVRESVAPTATAPSGYSEYLVRKKIAEMAVTQTGAPWYEDDAFKLAMVDPSSPVRRQAERAVGQEQSLLTVARKLIPLELQWLPNAEAAIRSDKYAADTAPIGTTEVDAPLARGYSGYASSKDRFQIKLQVLQQLPEDLKWVFIKKNPDVEEYLRKQQNKTLLPSVF
jgi:hypothetical protein